ncbi:hypothetical protein [Neobacillus sp. 114]|uniref:hypothetical protein n=1 Tax=Neobacillus sp. 114 TaxID=3048535 RepID=UPI0024C43915|nr:hypothetical protein [Neobacillus sp. 114]
MKKWWVAAISAVVLIALGATVYFLSSNHGKTASQKSFSANVQKTKTDDSAAEFVDSVKEAYEKNDYTAIYQSLSSTVTKNLTLEQFLQSKPEGLTVEDIKDNGKESVKEDGSFKVLKKPIRMKITQNGQTKTINTNWVFVLENGQWKFVGSDE